jgi:hypothetical protein
MFNQNNPARDVWELMDFLERENEPNYLYRGQNRQWNVLVPSFYRKLMTGKALGNDFWEIDENGYSTILDTRARIRFKIMKQRLIQYGKMLGNLVAQQYGLSSEAVDITDIPRVALFFCD